MCKINKENRNPSFDHNECGSLQIHKGECQFKKPSCMLVNKPKQYKDIADIFEYG